MTDLQGYCFLILFSHTMSTSYFLKLMILGEESIPRCVWHRDVSAMLYFWLKSMINAFFLYLFPICTVLFCFFPLQRMSIFLNDLCKCPQILTVALDPEGWWRADELASSIDPLHCAVSHDVLSVGWCVQQRADLFISLWFYVVRTRSLSLPPSLNLSWVGGCE